MGYPRYCAMMVSSVLKQLGQAAPSEKDLQKLLSRAVEEVKESEGLDKEKFDLRLAAVSRD